MTDYELDYEEWAKGRGVEAIRPKERPERITVDDYGLKLAEVVALRAACTRRQVGAVIIDENKRILSTGYNGAPSGEQHCSDGGCPRGADPTVPVLAVSKGNGWPGRPPCIALHAERNAIDWVLLEYDDAEARLPQSTIYITCAPCPDCESLATQYGLRIVWPW